LLSPAACCFYSNTEIDKFLLVTTGDQRTFAWATTGVHGTFPAFIFGNFFCCKFWLWLIADQYYWVIRYVPDLEFALLVGTRLGVVVEFVLYVLFGMVIVFLHYSGIIAFKSFLTDYLCDFWAAHWAQNNVIGDPTRLHDGCW